MYLKNFPSPSFFSCSTRIFALGEEHITRHYSKSVLILMLDGELRFREDGKEIILEKNEYYIQRNGLFQEGVPLSSPPTYFYIEFVGEYSDDEYGLPLRGRFDPTAISSLTEKCERLYRQRNGDAFKLNSYMCRIFSELGSNKECTDEHARLAQEMRNHIDSDYHGHLTLDSLSALFGYEKDYLARIFKEHYGISPHKYITEVRMEQAHWMLENTALSAEQIALSVGYSDFSAFYRNFRKSYSVSPSSLRKKRLL